MFLVSWGQILQLWV